MNSKPGTKHFKTSCQKAGWYWATAITWHSSLKELSCKAFIQSQHWKRKLVKEKSLQLPCCSNSTSVCTEKIKRQRLLPHLPTASTELSGCPVATEPAAAQRDVWGTHFQCRGHKRRGGGQCACETPASSCSPSQRTPVGRWERSALKLLLTLAASQASRNKTICKRSLCFLTEKVTLQ